jgi:cell division septal protein FtsQ
MPLPRLASLPRPVSLPRPASLPLRLWRLPLRRKLALAAAVALLATGGWLIIRDSPLFAVDDVTIEGLSADAAPVVTERLLEAARAQTTTDFSAADVRMAVAPYSLVTGVRATTRFPHAVTLHISERLPVARVMAAGRTAALAADGSVVTGFSRAVHLPTVRSAGHTVAGRTRDPFVLVALRVLGAAPPPLAARVAAVTRADGELTIYLHRGPRLIFGDGSLPHAKWDAAAAVLAARSSRGAAYIDLVLPSRPDAQVGDQATSLTAAHRAAGGAPAVGGGAA